VGNNNAPVLVLRSRTDHVIAERHMDSLYECIRRLGPPISYFSTNNPENHGISVISDAEISYVISAENLVIGYFRSIYTFHLKMLQNPPIFVI